MTDHAASERSAELEREYDFRWRHPDREAILARYTAESEAVVRERPAKLDLAYGKGPRERVDVFPAVRARAPVHVFIHGGYWRAHRKEDYRFVARAGDAAGGMATFVIEYDLAPAITLDGIVEQVGCALSWIRKHATDFNGDAARLVVSGHSAGAHLATMLALADRAQSVDGLRGCLAISGIYDLAPIRRTSINDDLRLDADAAARDSPIRYAAAARTPITIAYGLDETSAFHGQSEDFAAALAGQGRSHRLLPLAGLNHYDIVLELARQDSSLAVALAALVGEDA
jgi:arylformamidase